MSSEEMSRSELSPYQFESLDKLAASVTKDRTNKSRRNTLLSVHLEIANRQRLIVVQTNRTAS